MTSRPLTASFSSRFPRLVDQLDTLAAFVSQKHFRQALVGVGGTTLNQILRGKPGYHFGDRGRLDRQSIRKLGHGLTIGFEEYFQNRFLARMQSDPVQVHVGPRAVGFRRLRNAERKRFFR